MQDRKCYQFHTILSSVATFLFLHEAHRMSLEMKNELIAFDSFSFYCLANSHAVHCHQFCWPWRSIIPYFEQVLAHLILNNEIPSVVECNEIIQSLPSFPFMLLPILSLLKVGGEIKSILFIDFSPDLHWIISCVYWETPGKWMVLNVTAWAELWDWRQACICATLRLHSEIIACMFWCMAVLWALGQNSLDQNQIWTWSLT